MKKYLVKIQFDCNDADYVYGLQVIDENQKKIIEKNNNKKVSFGPYDFSQGHKVSVKNCISIEEIDENEFNVLKKLDLLTFGEGNSYWIKEILNEEEDDEELY